MRKNILLLFIIGFNLVVSAQPPQLIPYQAIARDNTGNPVLNQNIGLRFSIHDQTIAGAVVWQEAQTVVSNNLGIIVTALGGTTQLTSVNWGSGAKFLQVEMDIAGGTNYLDMGSQQMMSVPYALYAETSGSVINNGGGSGGNGSFTHWIGELYGGGIICHLWKDAQGVEHGLIASLVDLGYDPNTPPFGVKWQEDPVTPLDYTLFDAYVPNPYDGEINTQYLQNFTNLLPGNPAKLCFDYQNDGYSDWYLPAILELELIWNNIHVLNSVLINNPGSDIIGCAQLFANSNALGWSSGVSNSNRYWSSTYGSIGSNYRNMALLVSGSGASTDSNTDGAAFNFPWNVRAIRKF
jgi:hypothetical protein